MAEEKKEAEPEEHIQALRRIWRPEKKKGKKSSG